MAKKYVYIVLVMFSAFNFAAAQQYNGSASGNFLVYTMQSLTVTTKGGVISFNTPNDYFNGVVSDHYANIKVKSNANWLLSFHANSNHFTALSKNASSNMPSHVMAIRVNGRNNFDELTTNSKKLMSGNRGSTSDKHDFDIDMRFNPGFDYSGGVYSIGIVYTLTKK